MDEWADADDPKLRKICQYRLRAHVRHQDGRDSLAPSLLFADADYEVGDGTCGLHADAKSANEPAIVYFRGDALIDAAARIAELEAEVDAYREMQADIAASGGPSVLRLQMQARRDRIRAQKLEAEVADLEAALKRTEANRDTAMQEAGEEYDRAQKLEAENARLRESAKRALREAVADDMDGWFANLRAALDKGEG